MYENTNPMNLIASLMVYFHADIAKNYLKFFRK